MATGWTLKRFWTDVAVEARDGGFAVLLDGRMVRTPGKAPFVAPTRAIAVSAAEEWQAQTGEVRPATMPVTRTVNSAIDTLSKHRAAVVADLAGYGGTDLVCYRAEVPVDLQRRQGAGWDPLISWTGARFGAQLRTGFGVVPVMQPSEALEALAAEVARQDNFQLAAFHDLVVLSGSLVIALAVVEGRCSPEEGWALSRIDEDWQVEQWGADEEAETAAQIKRADFLHAARFHALCGKAFPDSAGH
jgi:chaperone required for assembly of F1-ATPase